jgi:hypothetical protein
LAVLAEQYILGGFATGTVRIFDIHGQFPKPPPHQPNTTRKRGGGGRRGRTSISTDEEEDNDMDDDCDNGPKSSGQQQPQQQPQPKNIVNSNTFQAFGAVACQIHARGVHTSLKLDVKVCEEEEEVVDNNRSCYCFASVVRGSMECVAIDLSSLLVAARNTNIIPAVGSSAKKNILDGIVVHRNSDAKLRGLGACTKLSSTTNHGNDRYLLLTGKSIKNIHIWSFTPPNREEESAAASWQCLYDTATNGTTIQWISVLRHNASQQLHVCSKSEGQCVRVWDLSHELTSTMAASSASSSSSDPPPHHKKQPRPPYRDLPGTDRALAMTNDWHCYSTGVFDPGHVQVQDLSGSAAAAVNTTTTTGTTTDNTISHYISFPTGSIVSRQRQYHTIERVEIQQNRQRVLALVSDGSVWYYSSEMMDDLSPAGGVVRRINSASSAATACHLSKVYGIVAGPDCIHCIPSESAAAAIPATTLPPTAINIQELENDTAILLMASSPECSCLVKKTTTMIEPKGTIKNTAVAITATTMSPRSPPIKETATTSTAAGKRHRLLPSPPVIAHDNNDGNNNTSSKPRKKKKKPRILLKNILNAAVVVVPPTTTPKNSNLRRSSSGEVLFDTGCVVVTDCCKASRICPTPPPATDRDGRMADQHRVHAEPETNDPDDAVHHANDAMIHQTPLVFRPRPLSNNNSERRNDRSDGTLAANHHIDSSGDPPPTTTTTTSPPIPRRKRQRICTPRKLETTQSLLIATERATTTVPHEYDEEDSGWSDNNEAAKSAVDRSSIQKKTLDPVQDNDKAGSTENRQPKSKAPTSSARKTSALLSTADRKRLLRIRACRFQMQRIDQSVRQLTVHRPRSELNYLKSRILLAVRRVIQDLLLDGAMTIAAGRARLECEILPAFRANVLIPLLLRHELETQQPATTTIVVFDDESFFGEAVGFVQALEQPPLSHG